MKAISLLALFAVIAGASALTSGMPETNAVAQASLNASAYVYNPIQSNTLTTSSGGSSTPRMLEQWPALQNMGIAQTSFVMKGCALRPPHVHMRATGLLYVIQGANLSVGFITEGGQSVVNYISTGASTIFPQGLIHYQQNLDCSPAWYTISYNNEDPGTQVTIPAYEKLPTSVAASALGVDPNNYSSVKNQLPTPAFIPNSDPDCVARCNAQGINVLAPASATLPPVTSAGR